MMAGHSRWKTLQAKRLAEADVHPEYEQAGLFRYFAAHPEFLRRIIFDAEPDAATLARHQEFIAECVRRIVAPRPLRPP